VPGPPVRVEARHHRHRDAVVSVPETAAPRGPPQDECHGSRPTTRGILPIGQAARASSQRGGVKPPPASSATRPPIKLTRTHRDVLVRQHVSSLITGIGRRSSSRRRHTTDGHEAITPLPTEMKRAATAVLSWGRVSPDLDRGGRRQPLLRRVHLGTPGRIERSTRSWSIPATAMGALRSSADRPQAANWSRTSRAPGEDVSRTRHRGPRRRRRIDQAGRRRSPEAARPRGPAAGPAQPPPLPPRPG